MWFSGSRRRQAGQGEADPNPAEAQPGRRAARGALGGTRLLRRYCRELQPSGELVLGRTLVREALQTRVRGPLLRDASADGPRSTAHCWLFVSLPVSPGLSAHSPEDAADVARAQLTQLHQKSGGCHPWARGSALPQPPHLPQGGVHLSAAPSCFTAFHLLMWAVLCSPPVHTIGSEPGMAQPAVRYDWAPCTHMSTGAGALLSQLGIHPRALPVNPNPHKVLSCRPHACHVCE